VSEWICLRCDWTGGRDGAACPRCGAALYRSPELTVPREVTPPPRPQPEPMSDRTHNSPIEAAQDEIVPPAVPVIAASRRWALIVGAIAVAAVWTVASDWPFGHLQTPAVPAPAETGPAVSNCFVTRCTETGPVQPTPTPPAGIIAPPTTGYTIDLNTGEITQLPKSIAGYGYAVSPDGTMVAYISGDDAGTGQVFIASLDGTDVQQVTHDRRGAGWPDWSPDGEAIAYTSRDGDLGNIFVLDLATGESSQVTHEKPTTVTNLGAGLGRGAGYSQFSPDGASIVYEVNRGDGLGVRIVPVTGGKSVLLVGGGKNDVQATLPALSPDGSTLAASCWGPELTDGICIAHADGTNLRTLVSGLGVFGPKWSPDGMRIAYFNAELQDLYGDYKIFVVDVATGETTFVAEGTAHEWLDDHTLIVEQVSPG
jgi:Dipeptidyl peptidase IV (DPP IV) N-terminal region